MNPSPSVPKLKYVGLDVHAQTVAVAIADATGEARSYGRIPAHTPAMDQLHRRLTADGSEVRYVYEAGPTGFGLCRHLRAQGLACAVVSPSLIPKRAADRVKTDRRDALTLARLLRAGELTSIHVPDEADEAIRDLVRCRQAAVEDLRRCRQRLQGFLLRYGRRYPGRSSWTAAHLHYLSTVRFPFPAQQIAFEELLQAVQDPARRIERLEAALEAQLQTWKRRPLVQAFRCFRGLARINAIIWVAEIGDFSRFAHPSQLMAFLGITPSENSSGQRRQQGAITKTGNGACRRALIEAAWQYRLPARVTPAIRARQRDQPQPLTDLAWKAQVRLCGRFQHLVASRKKTVVALTAIARELAGFLWAAARLVDGLPVPIRPQPPASPPPRAPRTHSRTTKEYVLRPDRRGAKTPAAQART